MFRPRFKFHSNPDRRKSCPLSESFKVKLIFCHLWDGFVLSCGLEKSGDFGRLLVILGGLTLMREDPHGREKPTCPGDSPRVNRPAPSLASVRLCSEQSVFKVSG